MAVALVGSLVTAEVAELNVTEQEEGAYEEPSKQNNERAGRAKDTQVLMDASREDVVVKLNLVVELKLRVFEEVE